MRNISQKKKVASVKWLVAFLIFNSQFSILNAAPPPDLPGIEITDSEIVLEQSKRLVQKNASESVDVYKNKGWVAPSLEEQLNQDETFIGMGQGAIFVPRFSESRLEPEFTVIKTDSLSKEYADREWIGKPGIRLVVPFGDYKVFMGSGVRDKQFTYDVKVEEGKTTLISPDWGGLVINTINEDGEFISESYEIFDVQNGESYGKGFGLTQERINDLKMWILRPQVYRISRSGENASSILNYITVQVNPGELTNVEIVFDEVTGRLVAGGVQKIRINKSKNSNWTYGLRIGGSMSYTTLLSLGDKTEQKSSIWNALGDLRLRALYAPPKIFWLTELYARENMQWLNEEKQDAQWSIAQDLMQFQSSVVYRFLEWIGPYTRLNVKTHIFPEYYWLEDEESLKVDSERIRLSSPFDPLLIGEGVGLNLRPIVSNSVDLSAQTGFAMRQVIRRKLLIPSKTKDDFTIATSNSYEYGWENSLSIRLSLTRFVTLDLIGEIFFPNAKIGDYQIEELSADLRIAITRFLELSYQHQLYDRISVSKEDTASERFESLNTVQLRLYVNF